MTALNTAAKTALRDAGVTQAAWARQHLTDGRWHGDACGCPDDRCAGYHHGDGEDCGCLRALLERHVAERMQALSTRHPGGAVRIRLEGLEEECREVAGRLRSVVDVISVSEPYANRGASRLVRVYVDARLDPSSGHVSAEPVRQSRRALPAGGSR